MTLKSQMATDMAAVFLNTSDFASSATFYPGTSVTGFSCSVLISDIAEKFVSTHSGTADQKRVRATVQRSAIRTGIQAIETTARDPARGDYVTVDSADPYAGRWLVEAAVPDVGDGMMLDLRLDSRYEAAAPGAVEVSS